MKKLISVFLTAIILIMSVFCVGAFAQEQTKSEKWMQNFFEQEAKIRVTTEVYGEETVSDMYFKDGKIASVFYMPLSRNIDIKIKVIINNGYFYILFPDFPLFHLKDEITEDMLIIPEADELTYLKSYEKQDGTITYYVEEFTNEQNMICKYYFIGENLIRIEAGGTDEYGEHSSSIVEILSDKVDDSVFRVPFFSINIAPLFDDLYII